MTQTNINRRKEHHARNPSVSWPSVSKLVETSVLPSHLKLSGSCSIKLNNIEILPGMLFMSDPANPHKESLLDKHDTSIKIGAWFSGRDKNIPLVACNEDESFELAIPIDEHSNEVLKLGIYLDTTDKESGNRKLYPLQTLGVNLIHLTNKGFIETTKDEFNESLSTVLRIRSETPDFPVHLLKPSNLRHIPVYNEGLQSGSVELTRRLECSNLRPPNPAKGFAVGLTIAPFLGMPSDSIPALHSHYGLIGAHINELDRDIPVAVPCYFFVSSLIQSGHNLDQCKQFMNKGCASIEYINLVANTVSGFTLDAMCVPYQRDATLSMDMVDFPMNPHLELGLATTEDMNIIFTSPALACECETTLNPRDAPKVNKDTSMADIKAMFFSKEYEELSRSLGKDDCESTAYAICINSNTIKRGDFSVYGLSKQLKQYKAFSGLSSHCLQVISDFFTGVQDKLLKKEIMISTVVGMAGEASAENVKDEGKTLNMDAIEGGGHCYAVLKYLHPEKNMVCSRILEGTNSTLMVSPHQIVDFTYRSMDSKETHTLDTCKFLCAASKTITALTQIGNSAIGGLETHFGWKGPTDNACATRSQMALNAEDPAFYKLCMYVGCSFDDKVYGHMPCSLVRLQDNMLCAGCFPGDIGKTDLQGINVDEDMISRDLFNKGNAILEEIFPPVAPENKFVDILNSWATLPVLSTINQLEKPAKEYVCINSMESPASPHLQDLMYYAKSKVCDLANQKNAEHPESDGAFFNVNKIGTGVTITSYWPIPMTKCVTLVHSLREAMEELDYNKVTMT